MCRRDAPDKYSVAKYSHMLGGSLMVRVESDAMSLMQWVIVDSSCELSSGGAAGYRALYSGMVLESHCSKLSIFASLNSCGVGVGSYSLQDISFNRSSSWLEHELGIVVPYVNASWSSLAASSSMSDSVSSLLVGAWAMGRTVSEVRLVVFVIA